MEAFLLFLVIFLGLAIIIEFPLAYSLGIAASVTFVTHGFALNNLAGSAFSSLDNFDLLAMPFFVFAGYIMQYSRLADGLFKFINSFVGRFRASTGAVGIATCALFGTLTGSMVATVAAIGQIMFPEMKKKGYDPAYAGAIVANSGMLGQMIPPSSVGIIYAMATSLSISDVWLSTVGPAILIVILYSIYNYFVRRNKEEKCPDKFELVPYVKNIAISTKEAIWALLMPIIIFGGIYGGVFTPTEAGAVAAVYGAAYYFIKKWRDPSSVDGSFGQICTSAVGVVGSIMLIMAFATAAGRAMSFAGVSGAIMDFFETNLSAPWQFLLATTVLFTICGMLVDGNVAILLFIPLLTPMLEFYGIDPVFYACMVLMLLLFGNVTPPFCVALFMAAKLTGQDFAAIFKNTLPFLLINYVVLLIVIFFPQFATFLVK
ncbi:MAG: TRAP transporter large permease [Firmicutes bacterium]|nr:TRAP transporter large permease [Bacillota bacterium]